MGADFGIELVLFVVISGEDCGVFACCKIRTGTLDERLFEGMEVVLHRLTLFVEYHGSRMQPPGA